jgi:hypothetical protein
MTDSRAALAAGLPRRALPPTQPPAPAERSGTAARPAAHTASRASRAERSPAARLVARPVAGHPQHSQDQHGVVSHADGTSRRLSEPSLLPIKSASHRC